MASIGSVHRSTGFPHAAPGAVWVVDNYDSFTENLVHALAQLGADVALVRNDACRAADVLAARPVAIVLSPGPKTPREAGISIPLVLASAHAIPAVPLLGVCLGHQAIGEAFGASVVRARHPVHGRATNIFHRGDGLFEGVPSPFPAARYHSLVVSRTRFPACLATTARSAEGEIMGLRHRTLPIVGVQFHPESYMTPIGPRLLAAFLRRAGVTVPASASVVR